MEKKDNQRIRLTKQLIHMAFLQLVQSKGIRDISIRELCSIAGINRTTFYHHYGSQYDVYQEIADQYLNDIAEMIAAADMQDRGDVHAQVTLGLQYMRNHLELSKLLMNNHVDDSFARRLFVLPQLESMLEEALSGVTDPRRKAAIITFAIYGGYKLLHDWVNDPDPLPPETEAGLILELARRVCFG